MVDTGYLSLAQAAKEFGVSQNYLRFLIFKKKLQGIKIGRNWVTTREWMDGFFPPSLSQKNDSVETLSSVIAAPTTSVGARNDTVAILQLKPEWIEVKLKPTEENPDRRIPSYRTILLPLLFLISYVFAASAGFAPFKDAEKLTSPYEAAISESVNSLSDAIFSGIANLPNLLNPPELSFDSSFAFTLPSLRLPKFSLPSFFLPSFFSELFKPSPPPPSEIAIPMKSRIDAEKSSADIRGTHSPVIASPDFSRTEQSPQVGIAAPSPADEPVVIRELVDSYSIRNSLMSELSSLNQKIKDELSQDLSSLRSLYSRLSESNQSQTRVITLTQKIDTLGEATLSNITFSGTSNQFNLKDSDIPDDITVTGAISPTSLTVSNTLTVSGTGTSTYSGGLSASVLNITSTTATSTFSNGIQLSGGCFKNAQGDCLTSTSPGGQDTQIQFNSNSTFGGDANLIWDNTSKRLGLGTTTPASLLSVQGNALISGTSTVGSLIATSTLFVGTDGLLFNVLQNGRVGIGTTSPGSLLSVHGGNAQITGTTTASGLIATSTLFVGSQGNLLNVLQSGFVGIGTTSPSSLLSIQGIANFVSNATSTLYTTLSLPNLYSTSTTATSSIAGSLYVASSTPTQNALFAVGTSSPLLWIDRNTGRLGVGTSSPGLAFSVNGDILGSGILNLTGTGTSTYSGGIKATAIDLTSTTATSTFGNGIQLSGGCYRTPSGNCLKEVVTVIKTVDETVNNSETVQNDDELFLAMAANETWFFTAVLGHVGNSTADFRHAFTVPAGASLRWGCSTARVAADGLVAMCNTNTTSGTSETLQSDTSPRQVLLVGIVVNGANAGNLQLQWAQGTATVVDTKVLANSYLEAHK